MSEATVKDLVSRGYQYDEAIDIVGRAMAICSENKHNWNCAGDLLVGSITWGSALELALEDYIIAAFRSGRYQVPRDWS